MWSNLPHGLLVAARDGDLNVLIGSGASIAAGLPDWATLLARLASDLPRVHRAQADRLIRAERYADAAQILAEAGSDAEAKGLRAGDIITEAAQEPVTSVAAIQERVQAARDAGRRTLLLMVRSNGDPRFVALSIE